MSINIGCIKYTPKLRLASDLLLFKRLKLNAFMMMKKINTEAAIVLIPRIHQEINLINLEKI